MALIFSFKLMFSKKGLAYVFLIVCLVVFGYLIYDTFVLVNSDKDDIAKELEKEEEAKGDKTDISIVYNDYSINRKVSFALYDQGRVYLYEGEQACESELMNTNYIAFFDIDGIDSRVVKSASLVVDPLVPKGLMISGIPDITNEISMQQSDLEIGGEINLIWSNREIKGHIQAQECVRSL